MQGITLPIMHNPQDTACPVCLPVTEGQSVALVSEAWRSFRSLCVGKRRVFVRQFPLLANREAAGAGSWFSSAFLEDSNA